MTLSRTSFGLEVDNMNLGGIIIYCPALEMWKNLETVRYISILLWYR